MRHLLGPRGLGIVVTLLSVGVGVAAQPTLPRDQAPVVPRAIRPLVDRLYSPDPQDREEAACQLGRRHAVAAPAIPILLSMLSDDVTVPALECEMSQWVRRTLPVSPDAQPWMQTSPAQEAAEALGNIGNAAVPGLLQSLGHTDWTTRKFAAVGLAEVDQPADVAAVVAALAGRLNDTHAEVRDRSAWALGEIESPRAVPALTGALGDANIDVRRKAAWALGEIQSTDAVPELLQALADSDVELRRQAAWALGEIEHVSAVDGLVRALRDDDWAVRRTAAWALGEIDDPRAIDDLRAAAADANADVRRAIAQALRELGDRRRH